MPAPSPTPRRSSPWQSAAGAEARNCGRGPTLRNVAGVWKPREREKALHRNRCRAFAYPGRDGRVRTGASLNPIQFSRRPQRSAGPLHGAKCAIFIRQICAISTRRQQPAPLGPLDGRALEARAETPPASSPSTRSRNVHPIAPRAAYPGGATRCRQMEPAFEAAGRHSVSGGFGMPGIGGLSALATAEWERAKATNCVGPHERRCDDSRRTPWTVGSSNC